MKISNAKALQKPRPLGLRGVTALSMTDGSNSRSTGGGGLGRDPEDKEVVGLQRSERRSWHRSLQTLRSNTQALSGNVFNSSGLSATSSTPAVSGNLHKYLLNTLGFPGGAVGKKPPANAGDAKDAGSIRVEKIPWSRKWQPTPVFLPGKFKEEPGEL